MKTHRDYPLKTKRSSGRAGYDLPRLPVGRYGAWAARSSVEWLKNEWRTRGLLKRVQLTISGVGPCDVDVVVIMRPSGTEWLGNIAEVEQYRSLLEWGPV